MVLTGYEFGPYFLDCRARVLFYEGKILPLQPKAIGTLMLLIENRGDIVTRQTILDAVWAGTNVEEGSVTQCVFELRKALVRPGFPNPIRTVHRRGYVFTGGVRPRPAALRLVENVGPSGPSRRQTDPEDPGNHEGTVAERVPLGTGEALRIAAELAAILEEKHAAGIFERDIRPGNLSLGADERVRLMDENRVIPGAWRAPERSSGYAADALCDIFSLGVVLAETVTGRHSFEKAFADLLLPDGQPLAPGVFLLLRRLLAKFRSNRYQSLAEVISDLKWLSSRDDQGGPGAGPGSGPSGQSSRISLFGRGPECDCMVQCLDAARSRRGSVILMSGERGVGRTRLAEEFLARAGIRGFLTLAVGCREIAKSVPYEPFAAILAAILRVAPPAGFIQSLGGGASEMAALLPEIRDRFPHLAPRVALPPERERQHLFGKWRDYVERLCRVTPIAIVFDDLHYADEPSLHLLADLVSSVSYLPLVVVVTYLGEKLAGDPPLASVLSSLRRSTAARRVALTNLDPEAAAQMLGALAGKPAPPDVAELAFSLTAGNPCRLQELVWSLDEQGRLFDRHGNWRSAAAMQEASRQATA